MVMVTPAFRALLDNFPDAEFHLLTSTIGQRVFSNYSPRVTAFIVHDRKSMLQKFKFGRILKHIRQIGYDLVFCFESNPTFKAFYEFAGDRGHCIDTSPLQMHYARRCLNVVADAIVSPLENYWLNLPVKEEARIKSRALLYEAGIDEETIVIGIHPTYSGIKKATWRRKIDRGRRWPPENFAQLAGYLISYAEKHHLKVRLIMDLMPSEAPIGNKIVHLSQGRITMLTAPPDFQRYLATVERMNLLVTSDTGPMHIGGAVGTQLVALFAVKKPEDCGPFIPPERYCVVQSPSNRISDIHPRQVMDFCRRFLPSETSSNKKTPS